MVSVLLPTVRPHLLERSFRSIHPAADGIDYEVIVVADFDPSALAGVEPDLLEHCQWAVRERRGVVDALNLATLMATGDYLFSYNDESMLGPGALRTLLAKAEASPFTLLTPLHMPAYNFVYYGKVFAPFPFAHRDLIAMLGGIADPIYKTYYADPDLSLRAHEAGIPVRVVPEAVIYHHQNVNDDDFQQNWAKYRAEDCQAFKNRWKHLGVWQDA